jgi:hypothetical protein
MSGRRPCAKTSEVCYQRQQMALRLYKTRDQASDRQRLGCRSSEVDFCQRCDRRIATTPLHEQVATWAGRCSDICKFSQLSYHTRHGADKRSASILSPPYTLKIAKQSCTESAHSTFVRHHVGSNALHEQLCASFTVLFSIDLRSVSHFRDVVHISGSGFPRPLPAMVARVRHESMPMRAVRLHYLRQFRCDDGKERTNVAHAPAELLSSVRGTSSDPHRCHLSRPRMEDEIVGRAQFTLVALAW